MENLPRKISRRLKRVVVLAPALLVSGMLMHCSDYSAQLREGYRNLKTGKFDAALERFQQASRRRTDDPRLQAGLGFVLSLKRISLPASLRLLESSLKGETNEVVRWELLRLYLDMGMHDQASELLSSRRIAIEKLFTPRMELMRDGVKCLAKPGKRRLKALLARDAGKEPHIKEFFVIRCRLAAGQTKEALEQFKKLEHVRTRCELLVNMEEKIRTETGESVDKCKQTFPDSVYIHRETPPNVGKLKTGEIRKLFPDREVLPPYEEPPNFWRLYQKSGEPST